MKVLHITPSLSSVRGGVTQAVIEMVQTLQAQGHEVEIVTTNDNGTDLLNVPLRQRVIYCGVPVWFFPRFSPPIGPIREFQFSSELWGWLWRYISDYDLLHVHAMFCYPCTMAMIAARIRHIPYVNQPHGLLCAWSLQQSKLKKQIYLALVERANLNHSQALQLTSAMERQEVSQLGLVAPSVISPLGLFVSPPIPQARQRLRQVLGVAEHQPVILFMSRLHPKKGLDYLIPALGKLHDRSFTFILAGNGAPSYEAEVDTLLAAAGIQHCTYRPGFVTGEQKDLLLQGSDIFVLTSHSENFGVVVLEAMAAGLATILTPGVAMAEILADQKVGYVPALDIATIADTLQQCLDQPDEVKAMGNCARELIAQHYTWPKVTAKVVETYTQIVQQKSLKHV
jgi:glycosyltransferase involved in cell wall biosynthesis